VSSANATMTISVLGAPAPPATDTEPPCGPRGPRVPVATLGWGGSAGGFDESGCFESVPWTTRALPDRTTDGGIAWGRTVTSGGAADAVLDSWASSTKAANVGFGKPLAWAIPGSD
jgi:hypothetical protein